MSTYGAGATSEKKVVKLRIFCFQCIAWPWDMWYLFGVEGLIYVSQSCLLCSLLCSKLTTDTLYLTLMGEWVMGIHCETWEKIDCVVMRCSVFLMKVLLKMSVSSGHVLFYISIYWLMVNKFMDCSFMIQWNWLFHLAAEEKTLSGNDFHDLYIRYVRRMRKIMYTFILVKLLDCFVW